MGSCAAAIKDSSWQPLVHDLTNEGLAFGHELAESLRTIHSVTSDSLEDDGFLFQLYLPEGDAVSVFERADALAGWVNHFLLGLGVTQPKLDKIKDETGEAIDDLRNIAQLGVRRRRRSGRAGDVVGRDYRVRARRCAAVPRNLFSPAANRTGSSQANITLTIIC
ncbi:Uncharacterized protein conserved in bacteria [Raoultella planticola]|uniref:Uncharacterized protein conserved in bacteria n=1 Tax=Raoultella planticola TaxID=575 RepID=A0A485BLM5_RAOPL|nr:Uncharacterized protein conserved in bacteria [Raoultella planticola]